MKLSSTNVGKTMTFQTYAGVKYKNLKLVSLLDADTVASLGKDPQAKHIQNMPYMKDPKPVNYYDYLYAKFVDADGKAEYLGIPWVDEDSIVATNTPNAQLTLTAPSQEQLDSLKSYLTANGYENWTLTFT